MLTAKQEMFVQNIVKGMTQREAYKNSYNAEGMTDNSIDCEACKLFNSPKITQRYKELIGEMQKATIMTAQERLEFLTRVITGEEPEREFSIMDGEHREYTHPADLNVKLKAVDLMNKMQGEYITKVVGNLDAKLEDLL